jgi:hypothetical protein
MVTCDQKRQAGKVLRTTPLPQENPFFTKPCQYTNAFETPNMWLGSEFSVVYLPCCNRVPEFKGQFRPHGPSNSCSWLLPVEQAPPPPPPGAAPRPVPPPQVPTTKRQRSPLLKEKCAHINRYLPRALVWFLDCPRFFVCPSIGSICSRRWPRRSSHEAARYRIKAL